MKLYLVLVRPEGDEPPGFVSGPWTNMEYAEWTAERCLVPAYVLEVEPIDAKLT